MVNIGNPFPSFKRQRYQGPKNSHPVTCLPTVHKMLTAALTNRIYNHLLRHNNLPEEQKVCHRMLRGCTDQLLVTKMITLLVKKHQTSLYGMNLLQESLWQTTSHLDSQCHGDVLLQDNLWRHQGKNRRLKFGSTTPKGMSKQEKWLLNRDYSKVTSCLNYCSV